MKAPGSAAGLRAGRSLAFRSSPGGAGGFHKNLSDPFDSERIRHRFQLPREFASFSPAARVFGASFGPGAAALIAILIPLVSFLFPCDAPQAVGLEGFTASYPVRFGRRRALGFHRRS